MSLTPKQEEFAQQWYATGNKTEAYRRAYNAKNMTDEVTSIEANKVSSNPKVSLRFPERNDVRKIFPHVVTPGKSSIT